MSPVRSAVLITATPPEPRSFGKQVVMGGILDHLCGRLGGESVHVVLVAPEALEQPATSYRMHRIAKPSTGEQVRTVLRRVVGRPHTSLQEATVHAPRVRAELQAVLQEIDADLEIWDTVRMGQYVPDIPSGRPRLRVLYADDLFSERYATMLKGLSSGTSTAVNPMGAFENLLPGPARRVLRHRAAYRPLLQLERRLVAGSEFRQPAWFDRTLLVSQEETATLRERCPGVVIDTLLPLVREPASSTRHAPDGPVFIFLGGLDFAPNADGLAWFLSTCRDEVLSAVPHAQILVVGRGAQRPLPEAGPWGESVSFLGFVDDLDGLLARCTAMISPLRIGSGVKIKILEALARGLPIVATAHSVHGLGIGAEQGCLIADNPAAFAAAMARTCDPAQNVVLSEGARAVWDARYAPSVLSAGYDTMFGLTPPLPPATMVNPPRQADDDLPGEPAQDVVSAH